MSLIDASLSFVPYGAPAQSMVGAAGVAIPIGIPFDLLGSGVGTPPVNYYGTPTLFGMDPGSGFLKPFLRTIVGVTFTTANSATLNLQLQYAVDTGAGGGYQPGTWNTIVETGVIAVANLLANTILPKLEFEPTFPYNVRPRYVRLNGAIAAATNFTAGTISFAGILAGADELAQKLQGKA